MKRSIRPRQVLAALLPYVALAAVAACAQQPASEAPGADLAPASVTTIPTAPPSPAADASRAQPIGMQQPQDVPGPPPASATGQAAAASQLSTQRLPAAFVCVPADDWQKAQIKPPHKSSGPAVAAPPASAAAETQAPPRPANPALISVLGKKVVGRDGEDLGRLVDVLADSEGQTRAAIIDFGGFLGVGNRRVAVDWRSLQIDSASPGKPVVLSLSRDQIKAAPEFKELDLAHPPIVANPTANAPAQPR